MIPWDVLIRWVWRLLPYGVAIGVVVAFGLWINGMRSTIEELKVSNGYLKTEIAAEKLARERDVAGLTTLASGLAAASSATKKDNAILQETINVAAPQPATPGLARFIECLRAGDRGGDCPPAASTGGSPAKPAGSAR